jgi:hypothetical protein
MQVRVHTQPDNTHFLGSFGACCQREFRKGGCGCCTEPPRELILLQSESVLSLVRERDDPPAQTNSTTSPLEPFDVPDADLIIRSSDLVDFRVHKPVLHMASPSIKDLLSLPQPSDSELEFVDGLPVVQLSEDSELLNCLLSILYPVQTVMPKSFEKVSYCTRL